MLEVVLRHRTGRRDPRPLLVILKRAHGLVAELGRRKRGRLSVAERILTMLLSGLDGFLRFTGHVIRHNASLTCVAGHAQKSGMNSQSILYLSRRRSPDAIENWERGGLSARAQLYRAPCAFARANLSSASDLANINIAWAVTML